MILDFRNYRQDSKKPERKVKLKYSASRKEVTEKLT